jgi:hypothetical protein
LWLNHKPLVAIPHKDHLPAGLRVENNPNACGEDDPIYSMRLERDGWKKVQDWKYGWAGIGLGFETQQPEIRVKDSAKNRGMTLLMERSISVFKYRESFSVRQGKEQVEIRNAEWADIDQARRLVFARAGRLYACDLTAFPMIAETLLTDLNPSRPEGFGSTGLGETTVGRFNGR